LRELIQLKHQDRAVDLIAHALGEESRFLRALDLWAALQLAPDSTQQALAQTLRTGEHDQRIRAAELLGLSDRYADERPLLEALDAPSRYLRVEVILALAKLRHIPCDEQLATSATRDPSEQVRRIAIWAIYERGGVIGLRSTFAPLLHQGDPAQRLAAGNALSLERIRSSAEEGSLAFRYDGRIDNVLELFRRAELGRTAENRAAPDIAQRLESALIRLDQQAPPFGFYVRHALRSLSSSAEHSTGTFIVTAAFNIKPQTARRWSIEFLAKTLVHDATHAYLHLMGEKPGEYRGELECFQEAFWAERLLTGRPANDIEAEVDRLLTQAHWTVARDY
jgi:hypothetical protein